MTTLFGSVRPLADVSAPTVVPYCRAIDQRVWPGWTTTVVPAGAIAGDGAAGPLAPGTCRTEPTTIAFGSARRFSTSSAATVVPYCAAMPDSVSPATTTTEPGAAEVAATPDPGRRSTEPTITVFGSDRRLRAAANADTVVRSRVAIDESVWPGSTTTDRPTGTDPAPSAAGMSSADPTTMTSGSGSWLAASSRRRPWSRTVPRCPATCHQAPLSRLSPAATTAVDASTATATAVPTEPRHATVPMDRATSRKSRDHVGGFVGWWQGHERRRGSVTGFGGDRQPVARPQ